MLTKKNFFLKIFLTLTTSISHSLWVVFFKTKRKIKTKIILRLADMDVLNGIQFGI